jgi:hypothetical protein
LFNAKVVLGFFCGDYLGPAFVFAFLSLRPSYCTCRRVCASHVQACACGVEQMVMYIFL